MTSAKQEKRQQQQQDPELLQQDPVLLLASKAAGEPSRACRFNGLEWTICGGKLAPETTGESLNRTYRVVAGSLVLRSSQKSRRLSIGCDEAPKQALEIFRTRPPAPV